ncbi:MAG: leucyl aminopeptidase [Candidatus Kerfeldbacteria bacterium CG15_BIG_FIL_POST_REV_8_21_14_020_45_12]|uniref:Probable cytosol aminopeptidase n=1 Tax=Candidatus Kerfeldbacteria bacterium CG15_BIG_FIL_POST_REV_8_21_14_020_45_12 TaxID=2014247 RepID=A0A2M7H3M2_9BACT|nr:MAG: leucyl aminopeptidase [Candidatus Kerfeldbacteria bacterium CG15_BIG_FIL_POST_REV_8_21_14_020_45_12]PJA92757.1 MAG: leucyl aminopeptidase [Candidatus Kerfeldbacteria bacterium CG_4_9_14_3_um_filter_45_8]
MKIFAKKGQVGEESADVVCVVHFAQQKQLSGPSKQIDKAMGGYLQTVIDEEGFKGRADQTLLVHTHGQVPGKRVLIIGGGDKKTFTLEQFRRMAGSVVRAAKAVQADSLTISFEGLTSTKITSELLGQALSEGVSLASYQFTKYKGKEESDKKDKASLKEVIVLAADAGQLKQVQKGIDRGVIYAEGAMFVRDLVNEPAVVVKPKYLAERAVEVGKITGVNVKVYREVDLIKLKMGSFLSVAAGSDEEPYMVHLSYKPKKKNVKKIVFCGKGITFDSGGLSIKPAQYMETMKMDMAGAAAVLGMFTQIAKIKPDVEVHGVMLLTENMPSGKATRPGDVVTAYNGTTIEVTNTDAEGRLILADGLSWAEKEIKPDYMVDLATLTGAAIVALGQECAAYMGTDEKLLAQVRGAADVVGEPLWELPLIQEYVPLMKSEVADFTNSARTPWAGTILGGLFLQQFVEKTPWVHIDIAGPAFVEHQILSYVPKGGSGFGVRTLLELVSNLR